MSQWLSHRRLMLTLPVAQTGPKRSVASVKSSPKHIATSTKRMLSTPSLKQLSQSSTFIRMQSLTASRISFPLTNGLRARQRASSCHLKTSRTSQSRHSQAPQTKLVSLVLRKHSWKESQVRLSLSAFRKKTIFSPCWSFQMASLSRSLQSLMWAHSKKIQRRRLSCTDSSLLLPFSAFLTERVKHSKSKKTEIKRRRNLNTPYCLCLKRLVFLS